MNSSTSLCVHHWSINAENVGRCIKCGATKDYGWFNDQHLTQKMKDTERAMAGGRSSERAKKRRSVVAFKGPLRPG